MLSVLHTLWLNKLETRGKRFMLHPQINIQGFYPDSKVHGANMGPTWVLSAPDGPLLAPWTLLSE